MQINKKVSIIVPVYNTSEYLKRCITSLYNQIFQNIEIIAVDDGSTDDSPSILFEYMDKDMLNSLDFFSDLKDYEDKRVKIEFIYNQKTIHTFMFGKDLSKGIFSVYANLIQQVILKNVVVNDEEDILLYTNGKVERLINMESSDTAVFIGEIRADYNGQCYSLQTDKTRLKYVKHVTNRGLFQARLTGYKYVTGEYICSLDSDDYIGVDYLRHMIAEAVESDADVVFSSFVKVLKSGYKGIRTHGTQAVKGHDYYDEEIINTIFDSQGELSNLWFVWGKLYKKELWDKSYDILQTVNRHHIMLEDMIYGVVFSSQAHHYKCVDEDAWFYVQNDSASTSRGGGYKQINKNITDVDFAFDFIERYLKSIGKYEALQEKFLVIKDKWSRIWYEIILDYDITDVQKIELENIVVKWNREGILKKPNEDEFYFHELNTPWDERIENLKKAIISEKHPVISFDVFDTLVLRPFYAPSDLFVLLQEDFEKITQNQYNVNFADIRKKAEKVAREELKYKSPQFEEITLDEIYIQIGKLSGIDSEALDAIKQAEIEREFQFCVVRKKIKELYDLAIFLGKRVIAISDIYLSEKIVRKILANCGYNDFEAIYISSEYKLTKERGSLYQYVLDKLEITGSELLHMGDNWSVDCNTAQKYGIAAWTLSRPLSLLLNKVPDMNKKALRGNFGELLEKNSSGNFMRFIHAKDYFGIRCMLAVIANKIFDNPFLSYEPYTDFNRNPYNIGYMAMGMHEYGFIRWMSDLCVQNKVSKIHFVSRDGYLGKLVFDAYREFRSELPESDYFYMSRKSFLPLFINDSLDWWSIGENINYLNKTPEEILNYYMPILDYSRDELSKILLENGVLYERAITSEMEYIRFIEALERLDVKTSNAIEYKRMVKKYFSDNIKAGEVMCDIGYSGRAQGVISKLLGYGVDAFYLHTLGEKSIINENKYGIKIYSFYNHTPSITGKIREFVQSECMGSCIGYQWDDENVKPILESIVPKFHERYVIEQLHNGAVDFLKDFLKIFSKYEHLMTYRRTDISFIYENFLLKPRDKDMQVFKPIYFEDDLFLGNGSKTKRLIDIWKGDLEWENLRPKPAAKPVTPALDQDKSTVKNKVSQSVNPVPEIRRIEPFVTQVNAPKGLKKIKYFLQNDHIIMKKYMYRKYKGAGVYKIFNGTYNIFKKLSCNRKGLNSVGNPRKDYTLTVGKPILYSATSTYAILACMIHRLIFHPNEECHLMLSVWRRNKFPAIQKTGFFSKVMLWEDLDYREYDYKMDKLVLTGDEVDCLELEYRFFKEYEKLFSFKISDYSKIIIHGNSMPFGCHLARNGVKYEVIEDGAGIYSKPELLQSFIDNSFPKIEQYLLKKYKILADNKWCVCNYVNYSAQTEGFKKNHTVDFRPVELLQEINISDRRKIFDAFEVHEADTVSEKRACLLLTHPLAQRKGLTHDQEKYIFTLLADVFAPDCEEYHLKPHPEDRTDFSDIQGFSIINKNVLSELLWYEKKTKYAIAIATISTSIDNITCCESGFALEDKFAKGWVYLLRFYEIAKMIQKNFNGKHIKVSGINIYDELLEKILEAVLGEQCTYLASDADSADVIVAEKEKDIQTCSLDDKLVFFLECPQSCEYRKIQIFKHLMDEKYSFIDLNKEYIYILKNVQKPDVHMQQTMEISNMELLVSEVI